MKKMKLEFASLALLLPALAFADGAAMAPKFIWSVSDVSSAAVACDAGVTCDRSDGRFKLTFAPGSQQWPGISVEPKSGSWDLSSWGHVELTMTNPGDKPLSVGLRVDNDGDWKKQPWNSENVYLKPGETKIGKVIFGYQYGFAKGYKLDPAAIARVKVFLNGKSDVERILLLGDLSAAGAPGEKPPVDPSRAVIVPAKGVIVPLKGATEKNLAAHAGASGRFAADGSVDVSLGTRPGAAVRVKPASGYWNLNAWLKVVAVVRNTGGQAFKPVVKVDSSGGTTEPLDFPAVAPGQTATLEIPFIPKAPWTMKGDEKGAKSEGGTKYESHRVTGLLFSAVAPGASFKVVSVTAVPVVAQAPAWLGKRPPVAGRWRQTLAEEFNDGKLDEKVWSPYSPNYWDKRTHFTRENLIFRDGCVAIRYSKKRGFACDDPSTGKETDYASGMLDSYGRWSQLYGYFEARMKLPTKPGLWPAFWMMPDRGPSAGAERWMRTDTKKHGMEFDIMEHLTAWGPNRFNVACHWDGYGKEHRAVGTGCAYVPADKDGFITVGMLWLPGVFAVYGNGEEIARWESERVSNVPEHVFFEMVSGGWANEPLDDDELPDEFVIDWFRAWQLEP